MIKVLNRTCQDLFSRTEKNLAFPVRLVLKRTVLGQNQRRPITSLESLWRRVLLFVSTEYGLVLCTIG